MKLIIQIPCWNEQDSLADVIKLLPKRINGIDEIDIIVIDDGSDDNTIEVAKQCNVNEIVKLPRHLGLANAFYAGVQTAIKHNADILVNTDADQQYPAKYIERLIKPIISKKADIVIGDRLSDKSAPFSPLKMFLERVGSTFVSVFASVKVNDAASGFRAFNKDALLALYLHGNFSYTMESIMLAGVKKFRVLNVPITINKNTRESRLVKNIPNYIIRSMTTVLRSYLMYYPLRFFVTIGTVCLFSAFLLGLRFLYFYIHNAGSGHIQSLILLAILSFMGFQSIVLGLIGDVIAANRRLLEDLRLNMHTKD